MGGIVFVLIISFVAFSVIVPPVLTVINLYNLLSREPIREKLTDILTFTAGPLLTLVLWWFLNMPDWNMPIVIGGDGADFHTPLASWNIPTVLVLSAWAVLSFAVLRISKGKLPPVPTVLCISGAEAGVVLSIVFIVQLSSNLGSFSTIYLSLFPLNYIICAPRALRQTIACQTARYKDSIPENTLDTTPSLAGTCHRILSSSMGWVLLGFVAALPVLGILLIILVLFGQAPDAVIKAFTETSDWTFSQKISPQPVEYEGHYLCTAAARGHKKLVKPLRYGVRHGNRIIVNRQLCIANAFEELIQERTPRLHHWVRHFYDTHGYPLSKKITTPLRADITYLLMKPLEWLFLLVLYTFDEKPENRIALQYMTINH